MTAILGAGERDFLAPPAGRIASGSVHAERTRGRGTTRRPQAARSTYLLNLLRYASRGTISTARDGDRQGRRVPPRFRARGEVDSRLNGKRPLTLTLPRGGEGLDRTPLPLWERADSERVVIAARANRAHPKTSRSLSDPAHGPYEPGRARAQWDLARVAHLHRSRPGPARRPGRSYERDLKDGPHPESVDRLLVDESLERVQSVGRRSAALLDRDGDANRRSAPPPTRQPGAVALPGG